MKKGTNKWRIAGLAAVLAAIGALAPPQLVDLLTEAVAVLVGASPESLLESE